MQAVPRAVLRPARMPLVISTHVSWAVDAGCPCPHSAQAAFLQQQLHVRVEVVAISNSRRMVLSGSGLQGTDWQAALAQVRCTRRCAVAACSHTATP